MALTIKPEFQNKVLGFNDSAIHLGQRSQVDLKVLLVLAYKSHRADYVNYYVSPPTLDELLGNAPAGQDLSVATLLALLSPAGNVIFTQDGAQIRGDLNAVLDAPSGLTTHNFLLENFVSKQQQSNDLAALLTQLSGPTFDLASSGIFEAFWWSDQGVTLVDGEVESIADATGVAGNAQFAAFPYLRPAYNPIGGLNGKPAINLTGRSLMSHMRLENTPDTELWLVATAAPGAVGFVSEYTFSTDASRNGFASILSQSPQGVTMLECILQGDVGYNNCVVPFQNGLTIASFCKSNSINEVTVESGPFAGTATLPQSDNNGNWPYEEMYTGSRGNGSFYAQNLSIMGWGYTKRKTTVIEKALIKNQLNTKYAL